MANEVQDNQERNYGCWAVLRVGYCDVQDLFRYTEPVAYTCGVYGWNADIYILDRNIAIVTGYRPFGREAYDFIGKYAEKANRINREGKHYTKEDEDRLIQEMVKEIREKHGKV